MPTTKSAAKRMITSRKRRENNKAAKGSLHTTLRKLREVAAGGDKAKASEIAREYSSMLDKAVKQGSVKANNASRHKSRVAALLKK